jgi:preprotein translocase subunit YajC
MPLFERILVALILMVLFGILWWVSRIRRQLHQMSSILTQLVQRQANPEVAKTQGRKLRCWTALPVLRLGPS